MRSLNAITCMVVLAFCLAITACGGRVILRPGRDAYYQVTSQVVPAQSSGSHSQSASLHTSGSEGSYLPSVGPTHTTTTAPQAR